MNPTWEACHDAIGAVERWCYWPSEEHRAAVEEAWDGLPPSNLASWLCTTVRHATASGAPSTAHEISAALRDGLPETTAAQAARDEVRRWALKGLVGDPL